jgi:hypothetical protein
MHPTSGTASLRSFTLGTSLLALALLAACAGGGPRSPLACATDAECPSAARCVESTCVANAPPVAAISAPAAPEAYALVSLDGSGSSDPDSADAVVSFAWTVSALDAPCEPPVVAGTGSLARIRFGCAGRHAVQLVVTDRMGTPSAPAVREVLVVPFTGTSLVMVGPDVTTGHGCTGTPLRCAPDAEVAVTASAAPAGAGVVRYLWSTLPPEDRPLAADRRVTFLPGADAPSPGVTIETDGAAISGDWLMRVEARDDAGILGTGVVRVSIGNRPPAITGADPAPVPHTFLAAESAFVASGAVPVAVADPDGDPIATRTVTFRHAGDGEGTFEGEDGGDALTFRVRVPYAAPADALSLIGGDGLERAVELVVADVNGAQATRAFPVAIANRAPVETVVPSALIVAHSYDPAAQRYRASAVMSRWTDPDGDPLRQAGDTGDAHCASLATLADGTALVECGLAFTGSPGLAEFVTSHPVRQAIGDPWEAAATASYQVRIENRAPYAQNSSSTVSVSCPEDRSGEFCCREVGTTCVSFPRIIPAVSYTFAPQVFDDDGDPLEVWLAAGTLPTSQVCLPGQCGPVTRTLPMVSGCGAMPGGETTTFTVTDGVGSASATHTVTRTCQ